MAETREEREEEEERKEALDEEVTKLLKKKSIEDELRLLRKEIKATSGCLNSYSKQVMSTKDSVTRLAGRYNSYFNLKVPVTNPTVDFSSYSRGQSLRSLKIRE